MLGLALGGLETRILFALSTFRSTVSCPCDVAIISGLKFRVPAPILEDVDISYNVIRFNGSLLKENEFRQRAGPEVDAAWASLGVNCRFLAQNAA